MKILTIKTILNIIMNQLHLNVQEDTTYTFLANILNHTKTLINQTKSKDYTTIMKHVNIALQETNAVQAHKHTEPSQNTVQKCKEQ